MSIAKPARDADDETILTYLHMQQGIPVRLLQAELAAFKQGHEVPKYLCHHGVAAHWCATCSADEDAAILTSRKQRGRGST